MALNVPIQPRNRISFPIVHVTNRGLKRHKKTCVNERKRLTSFKLDINAFFVVEKICAIKLNLR